MNSQSTELRTVESALNTIETEIEALEKLRKTVLTPAFGKALESAVLAMSRKDSRVIVTGIGKSGHIARKIAATFRSTGTSALFLHPSEASHGDLAMITTKDVVFAITWSGETAELNDIFSYCIQFSVPLIVATAKEKSTAARAAQICLKMPQVREACPNDLAPTSSATLQLVLGDILAVALIEARGFSPTDFHVFHPGGSLGIQLLTVDQVMGKQEAVPRVLQDATISSATLEISHKRYGATAVVDEHDALVGVFTDGDLRRCISTHDLSEPIGRHMTPSPVTVASATLCADALRIMNEKAVTVLFVVDSGKLVGVVHMHDIVRMGIE
jgi:arabinose-5-phosphate isomerase